MLTHLDWNPVERRLPPVTEYPWEPQHGYLVTVKHLPYAISASYHYDDEGECIWTSGDFTLEDVIAWVEAPAAYEPSEASIGG